MAFPNKCHFNYEAYVIPEGTVFRFNAENDDHAKDQMRIQ